MWWWMRNRAAIVTLVVAWVAAVLSVPGSGVLVAFPNLTGGPGLASPASALLPLAAVVAYSYSLSRQNTVLEALALRRIWLADLLLAVLCVLPFAVVYAMFGGPELFAASRNAIGYFAATLVSTRVFGLSTSALIPLGWAIAVSMGLLPQGNPLWGWPLTPAEQPISWLVPGLLAVIAPLAYLTRSRQIGHRFTRLLPTLSTTAAPERT